MARFKARFAPAMMQIQPGEFAIVMPSRRREATRAYRLGGDIMFSDVHHNWVGPMEKFEDFPPLYDNPGGRLRSEGFEEHAEWLTQCLAEIDGASNS